MISPSRPIQQARQLAESGLAARIVVTPTRDFAILSASS